MDVSKSIKTNQPRGYNTILKCKFYTNTILLFFSIILFITWHNKN
jgi:hypothetical protein